MPKETHNSFWKPDRAAKQSLRRGEKKVSEARKRQLEQAQKEWDAARGR